jgi:hypothetical protein
MVRGGWPVAVVWIQYLGFGSRGETTGQSIVRRLNGCSKLILAPWERSATRSGDVATSARGEATLGRKKGGDDVNWADANLNGSKNKKKLMW